MTTPKSRNTAATALPVETPQAILARVCAAYGVNVEVLTGASRDDWACQARRAAVLALREIRMGWSTIGRLLGGRDHSTVMYAAGWRPKGGSRR